MCVMRYKMTTQEIKDFLSNIEHRPHKDQYYDIKNKLKQMGRVIDKYHAVINDVSQKTCNDISLSTNQMEAVQSSLTPLNLRLLRSMGKNDLMCIILTREGFYYEKIDEFQSQLKIHDREIFKTQQDYIKQLQAMLLDDSPIYKKYAAQLNKIDAQMTELSKLKTYSNLLERRLAKKSRS